MIWVYAIWSGLSVWIFLKGKYGNEVLEPYHLKSDIWAYESHKDPDYHGMYKYRIRPNYRTVRLDFSNNWPNL